MYAKETQVLHKDVTDENRDEINEKPKIREGNL